MAISDNCYVVVQAPLRWVAVHRSLIVGTVPEADVFEEMSAAEAEARSRERQRVARSRALKASQMRLGEDRRG